MKKVFLIVALLLVAGMAFAGSKHWWTCSATCGDNPKKYVSVCAEYFSQAQNKAAAELCYCDGGDYVECDRTIQCTQRETRCP